MTTANRAQAVQDIALSFGYLQQPVSAISPALHEAVETLKSKDNLLVQCAASERAICHRLAIYLESEINKAELPVWNVDCEYNLVGDYHGTDSLFERVKKKLYLPKRGENDGELYEVSVFPDLIAHRRNEPQNLLVIEMKVVRESVRARSKEDIEFDFRKLTAFTDELKQDRYKQAVLLVLIKPYSLNKNPEILAFTHQ